MAAKGAYQLRNVPYLRALIARTDEPHLEERLIGTAGRWCLDASKIGLPGVLARLCRIAVIGWSRLSHINGLPTAADRCVSASCCGSVGVQSKQAPGIRPFRHWSACRKCRAVG